MKSLSFYFSSMQVAPFDASLVALVFGAIVIIGSWPENVNTCPYICLAYNEVNKIKSNKTAISMLMPGLQN
jgi:hypothetical protein